MSIIKIIGIMGYLIVFISFFIPFSLNLNGFQITEYLSQELVKINIVQYNPIMNIFIGFPSYGLFLFSLASLSLFLISRITKKKTNDNLELLILILFINIITVICIGIYKLYLDDLVTLEKLGFMNFQIGFYLILIASIIIIIFNLSYLIYNGTVKRLLISIYRFNKFIHKKEICNL